MKKKTFSLFAFLLFALSMTGTARAQMGFLPQFLGNAAGVERPGFCFKFFPSYFYQHADAAHDVEVAFEPQYFIPGFTGDINRDQIQFAAHLPVGYRRQRDPAGGHRSVTGIGTLTTTIEYFRRLIDTEDLQFWFDNGITAGFPTATDNRGTRIGGGKYWMRIGGDAFSVGWFQESFIRYKRFMASVMPIGVSWTFRDYDNDVRGGLGLTIMNSSYGYAINDWLHLGVNMGLLLGGVLGAEDRVGNSLPVSARFFVGPAALLAFNENNSLQVSVMIDAVTKEVSRGQGIAIALWHHF